MSDRNCPSCGAPITIDTTECKYCGESLAVSQPQNQAPQYAQTQGTQFTSQGTQVEIRYVTQPEIIINNTTPYTPEEKRSTKSKTVAGLLGIFLGAFGIHKFYLGKTGMGLLYLFFCWTYIPAIAGFIEGIIYLTSSEEKFERKYVKK